MRFNSNVSSHQRSLGDSAPSELLPLDDAPELCICSTREGWTGRKVAKSTSAGELRVAGHRQMLPHFRGVTGTYTGCRSRVDNCTDYFDF